MSQPAHAVELRSSVGYLIKQVATALRSAMEVALDPVGLTVTEYSCLELLRQRSDLTNSSLARGTFVTRQSMNVVLRGLEDRGLVVRPPEASAGRQMPARLTDQGMVLAISASSVVREVERRMVGGMDAADEDRFHRLLSSCLKALERTESVSEERGDGSGVPGSPSVEDDNATK